MVDLHFLRAEYLIASVLVGLWVWAYWRRQRGNGGWAKRVDPHLLSTMLTGTGGRVRWPGLSLVVLGAVLVLSLAGPSWDRSEVATHRDGFARVFLIDMSRSMDADDLKPSRLAQARLKLLDLLATSDEGAVALIGFAAFPYTLTPLTDDVNTLRLLVPLIQTNMAPAQGADITAALTRAAELLEQAFVARGELVVISDSEPSDTAINLAKRLARGGLSTSVMSVGTGDAVSVPHGLGTLQSPSGDVIKSPPAHARLRELARAGGGEFVALSSGAVSIDRLLNRSVNALAEDDESGTTTLWRDDGAWLLWLALVPVLHLVRRGVLC